MKKYLYTWYKNAPNQSSLAIFVLSYDGVPGVNFYGNPMVENATIFSLYTINACFHINKRMAFATYKAKDEEEKNFNRLAIVAIFKKGFTIYE